MWLFAEKGFVSIVDDKDDPHRLMVRARIKGDIEALFPEFARLVQETLDVDYRFRASLDRYVVSGVIAAQVSRIDYTNFKDRVAEIDPKRVPTYYQVWAQMAFHQRDRREREARVKR